jgi:hypothetical protein
LVHSDSTIADLHQTLQIAMGWDDAHLHHFRIRGKDYGISRIGGIGFRDDPHQVHLADFHFGVPGAIAGKFTVSASCEKTHSLVIPIFISKNNWFEGYCYA